MKTITLNEFKSKRKEIAHELKKYNQQLEPTHLHYMSKELLDFHIRHDTVEFFLDEGCTYEFLDDLNVLGGLRCEFADRMARTRENGFKHGFPFDITLEPRVWEPKFINPVKLTLDMIRDIRKQIAEHPVTQTIRYGGKDEFTSEEAYINYELREFFVNEGYTYDDIFALDELFEICI